MEDPLPAVALCFQLRHPTSVWYRVEHIVCILRKSDHNTPFSWLPKCVLSSCSRKWRPSCPIVVTLRTPPRAMRPLSFQRPWHPLVVGIGVGAATAGVGVADTREPIEDAREKDSRKFSVLI